MKGQAQGTMITLFRVQSSTARCQFFYGEDAIELVQ